MRVFITCCFFIFRGKHDEAGVTFYPTIFVRWFEETAARMFNDSHVMANGMRKQLLTTFVNSRNPQRFETYIPESAWTPEQAAIAKKRKEELDKKKMMVHMQLSSITAPQKCANHYDAT